MRQIVTVLLQNEAGALGRVASLFSTRGYNIESLAVAPTQDAAVSRLTLVTNVDHHVLTQVVNQLRKLVDVVEVADLSSGAHCEAELLLVRLNVADGGDDTVRALIAANGGRILSAAAATVVASMTGTDPQISAFLEAVATLARVETAVRSGTLAI
jgi:acetolactate synthase-1/3 small subunit